MAITDSPGRVETIGSAWRWTSLLLPEDARRADGDWDELIPARDLGASALDLYQTAEVSSHAPRDLLGS